MGSWITKFVSVVIPKGGSGGYNVSTGVINHPPKGTKGPKVKGKMVPKDKK